MLILFIQKCAKFDKRLRNSYSKHGAFNVVPSGVRKSLLKAASCIILQHISLSHGLAESDILTSSSYIPYFI